MKQAKLKETGDNVRVKDTNEEKLREKMNVIKMSWENARVKKSD